MSDRSRLIVFFHSSRDVPGDVVVAALQEIQGYGTVRVRHEAVGGSREPNLIVVVDHNWDIFVWREKGARVRKQAQAMAARNRADPLIHQRLAACDHRFVVSYEPDVDMKYFNTWLFTAGVLAKLVDGFVYDPRSHELWESPA